MDDELKEALELIRSLMDQLWLTYDTGQYRKGRAPDDPQYELHFKAAGIKNCANDPAGTYREAEELLRRYGMNEDDDQ